MKASETYPALYKGLAQIPIKYLKANLLPKLETNDSTITYSGSIFTPSYQKY